MTTSRPRRLSQLIALAAVAVVLPLTGAATSQAAWRDFDCTLPSGGVCSDARHSLEFVWAYSPSGRMVGAGASTTTSSTNIVGGLTWGSGLTCNWFAGSPMLYPIVANGSSSMTVVQGTAEFGTGASGC
jgi:hypothetical protein